MNRKRMDRIQILQGDITTLQVDAIVNAANSSLLGGGGVDGAIHRAAGPELLAECKTIGGCPVGEARITRGYQLPARFVIHTVGPVYSGSQKDAVLLAGCYQNCLSLAVRYHIKTIAFPAISCGVYGYPIEKACKIAMDTSMAFLNENPVIQGISFILFSDKDFNIYKACLGQILC